MADAADSKSIRAVLQNGERKRITAKLASVYAASLRYDPRSATHASEPTGRPN
jgi:hypothetical protein